MRIAWISSWPPQLCGIASYSQELVEEIRKKGHQVLIVCHPGGGKKGERGVYPVINLDTSGWEEKLYQQVVDINPDVVHIQHEYGLYSKNNDYSSGLISPLFRWRIEERFPLVMTYHSVYTKMDRNRVLFMDVTLRIIHAGIVHEEYQKENLPHNLDWIPENVWVIPHGAKKKRCTYSKEEAKKSLGLEGKKIVGMIGWFVPNKGYHRVIKLWTEISKLLPDTFLVLVGEIRKPENEWYKREVIQLASKSNSRDRIKIILKVLAPEEYELTLSAFDILVLPYTFISQSGNLAHAFSLGVPVVASAIEGLKEEIDKSRAGIAVSPQDDEDLKRAIVRLMKDEYLRHQLSENGKRYVDQEINWEKVAGMHIELYQEVLKSSDFATKG